MKNLKNFLIIALILTGCQAGQQETQEWISLFDGSTLEGWKASENADTWSVEDGTLVCRGKRSHLFYTEIGRAHV